MVGLAVSLLLFKNYLNCTTGTLDHLVFYILLLSMHQESHNEYSHQCLLDLLSMGPYEGSNTIDLGVEGQLVTQQTPNILTTMMFG